MAHDSLLAYDAFVRMCVIAQATVGFQKYQFLSLSPTRIEPVCHFPQRGFSDNVLGAPVRLQNPRSFILTLPRGNLIDP